MGFINNLSQYWKSLNEPWDPNVFNSEDTSLDEESPFVPNWMFSTQIGQPRQVDLINLRKYAKSSWVQMATNAILKQMFSTEWRIVPKNEKDDISGLEKEKEILTNFLNRPNNNGDDFVSLWKPWMRDVLEMDHGVMYKSRDGKILKELFTYDAASFLIETDSHGLILMYHQYSFRWPKSKPLPFNPMDIVSGIFNRTNESYPYGFSPLQSIMQEVEVLIQSTRYNKDFYQNDARPSGIVVVPMKKDQLKRYQSQWESKVRGRPHKLMFHNVPDTHFVDMHVTNRDMEWLKGQEWYFHSVFGAYGISPQEAGYYENSNKSTSESQERISARNATRPYLDFLAKKINNDIFPEINPDTKLKFEWILQDDVREKEDHKQAMDKLDAGVYTINEIRTMEGLDPVPWGDNPKEKQDPSNPDDVSDDEDPNNPGKPGKPIPPKPDEDDEDKKKNKVLIDDVLFTEDKDVKDYEEFLSSKYDIIEREVLKAVNQELPEALEKSFDKANLKTFNDFVVRIMNAVNGVSFSHGLKKIIKFHLNEGHEELELQLDLNVPQGEKYKSLVDIEFDKQMDGYLINGKMWPGIKGVTQELQFKILKDVSQDVRDRKSIKQINQTVKDIMSRENGGVVDGQVTEGRSMRIARTESVRMKESGKFQAMSDTGLELNKTWKSKGPRGCKGCSPICDRLDGMTVKANAPFIDPVTHQEFQHPPAHPNCRSGVFYSVDE